MSSTTFVKAFPQGEALQPPSQRGLYYVGTISPGQNLPARLGVCRDCRSFSPKAKANCLKQTSNWNVGDPLPTDDTNSPCYPIDVDLGPLVRKAGWISKQNFTGSNNITGDNWGSLPAILFYVCLLIVCILIYLLSRCHFKK